MHRALLGLAAIAAIGAFSIPTSVQARDLVGVSSTPADRFGTSPFRRDFSCFDRRDRDGDRRHRRNLCRTDVVMDWYGGEWALYNNRSWAPDSYNDWWNDRPDRAYPAWMRRNENCQRQWFSGDVLRC